MLCFSIHSVLPAKLEYTYVCICTDPHREKRSKGPHGGLQVIFLKK